jgi:penicillin-binding protein 1A
MIVIDSKTGQIKALVGGFDFCSSQWNRVTQATRQVGSVIKPLIYATATLQGINCTTTDIDEPFQLVSNGTVWSPRNYNKKFNGQITLAYALSHSSNIISIKTLLRLNPYDVVDLAQKCRMKGHMHTYPSLALGCVDGTLAELVGMFNIFPNDGVYVEPHYIASVTDRCGARIYKARPEKERVLSSAVAGHIASVLCLGPERVKKMYGKNNWIKSEAMSKTGTTNDSRTCWFVGSTPTLTTAVYVGFDDNRSMGADVYPIKTAFPIWLAFNKEVDTVAQKFSYDMSLSKVTINEKTGQPCLPGSPGAITIMV